MPFFIASATFARTEPNPWMILPFILLLLSIALMPFIHAHWWERNYPKVAVGLGLFVALQYLFAGGESGRLLEVAHEYASFIALIGSLYIVCGGIHIRVRGEAAPLRNTLFLALGALLANLLGTTGAAMLLIRPWIRMNKYRITAFHIVFFIFITGNVGGALTPIGDPPLFLGYLKGVPFFWTLQQLWTPWLFLTLVLLAVFYAMDRRNFLRAPEVVRPLETIHREFRIEGKRNFAFIGAIIASVFLPSPWREAIMVAAAYGSLRLSPRGVHLKNRFSFRPVTEVAWLFFGIFATMIPALDYLQLHSGTLGVETPAQFFFLTGALSAFLDNAPTYLTFLATALGQQGLQLGNPNDVVFFANSHAGILSAISLGAVFFGAATYIGNGPNFMIKAIAVRARVKTPSFFGYILRYVLPILLPPLILTALIFLK